MNAKPLEVIDWPLGRACVAHKSGQMVNFDWECVTDADGGLLFSSQIDEILQGLSEKSRNTILLEVYTRIEDAKKGKCKPVVWKKGKRKQRGNVDRMGYQKADVLELIIHNKLEGIPQKCLRIYFMEPRYKCDLLAISAAVKPATKAGKKEQDEQWQLADAIAREWWAAQ